MEFDKPHRRTDSSDIPNDGRFNVTFTGNIGQAQGLDILIEVALLLKK